MTLRERAANALDLTHFTERGIHIVAVRNTLASWLDGKIELKSATVRVYSKYLESIA